MVAVSSTIDFVLIVIAGLTVIVFFLHCVLCIIDIETDYSFI